MLCTIEFLENLVKERKVEECQGGYVQREKEVEESRTENVWKVGVSRQIFTPYLSF